MMQGDKERKKENGEKHKHTTGGVRVQEWSGDGRGEEEVRAAVLAGVRPRQRR